MHYVHLQIMIAVVQCISGEAVTRKLCLLVIVDYMYCLEFYCYSSVI